MDSADKRAQLGLSASPCDTAADCGRGGGNVPSGSLTVGELGMAQLQVLARPGWVVLGAHGVLHALDVLLEVVERAEDVLHALAVVHHGLVGLVVGGAAALLGRADGQRLDHLAGGTL